VFFKKEKQLPRILLLGSNTAAMIDIANAVPWVKIVINRDPSKIEESINASIKGVILFPKMKQYSLPGNPCATSVHLIDRVKDCCIKKRGIPYFWLDKETPEDNEKMIDWIKENFKN
jgi:hypothetical protein